MCDTLTKKEMIHWIVEHPICSNSEIPDWLLELSESIDGDPKFRNYKFRELLQITFIRSNNGRLGMRGLETDGYGDPFERYSDRILHIFDVERQRRKAPFFEIEIEDVFSLDETLYVNYKKLENGPVTFSRKEILTSLENDDEEDDDWDFDCEKEDDYMFEPDEIEVNNKYDGQFLNKRFGKTMAKHSHHVRFMINTTGNLKEYYFKTKYDRLQNFIKSVRRSMDDIQQSLSIYFDRRVLLPQSGKNILSVYMKHNGINQNVMERLYDEIAGFATDCVGCDKMPPNGTSEFVGYFAPRHRTLYIKKDL
ncbi:MAG: hypothetical protein H8E70_09015 [Candidatus Marinimicrobia bacterium]|nr:hypothetical protein [Candidatus Neomarinimicrobiota bacterium]